MYDKTKEEFKQLESQLSDPEVINNPDKLKEISQKHANLKEAVNLIEKLEKVDKQIKDNKELIQEKDEEVKEMAKQELETLQKRYTDLDKQIKE